MEKGGFDVVIGNPPWGAEFSDGELKYLRELNKSVIMRMVDSYMYFIHKSSLLLTKNGIFGMILPSTLLTHSDMRLLRSYIINNFEIEILINLGEKVFGPYVLNTSTILLFRKTAKDSKRRYIIVSDLRFILPHEKEEELKNLKRTDRKEWKNIVLNDPNLTFSTLNLNAVKLFQKISQAHPSFRDIIEGKIQRGISPDYSQAFIIENDLAIEYKIEKEVLRPVVIGKHIARYKHISSSYSIIYLTREDDINKYPNVKSYLSKFRNNITCREVAEGKHPWYSLHRPRDPVIFRAPKLIGLTTTRNICCTIDEEGHYATDALYIIRVKENIRLPLYYVLSILNSKVFEFLYKVYTQGEQRVIPQIKAVKLYDLPFAIPDMSKKHDRDLVDKIITSVKKVLKLDKKIQLDLINFQIDLIEREIKFTIEKIDELVYELYGITEEEKKVIKEEND